MTVVVLGIDALDPDLVDDESHPNLVLNAFDSIDTISSQAGEPSTHELWPTIITGLAPEEHGLTLVDDGVAWESQALNVASDLADYILPNGIQTRIGAWILNNTARDAFRTPASYYADQGIATIFDGRAAAAIGVPNYVTDPEENDREHQLRRRLGDLFERDLEAQGGHTSSDPDAFYELCMEMGMVRIARTRRALRSGRYELVFGYTSALDLIGHVAYDRPSLQDRAYAEFDDFVGELRADCSETDVLVLVSDHGLQDGLHTHEAMIAATDRTIVDDVDAVTDVRAAVESELHSGEHEPSRRSSKLDRSPEAADEIRQQLEDLGYT